MKKLISLFIAIMMLSVSFIAAIPVSAAAGFSDVEDGRWSASSIKYSVSKGYMNGVGDGLFDPEGPLTRAMVATVLWRREGSPAPAAPSCFSDVPSGEWYTDAVAWARNAGVVKGLTETTFGPDEYITREQLATMLFRFSSSAPVSVPERADLGPFADDEKVSDWATEPLEWAVESNLIKGTDGNRLAPDGRATREQFAAVIERYDDTFKLVFREPVLRSHYTEKPYPLVEDADIYVSTNGDDSAAGTKDAPIASFARAVEMARDLKATKDTSVVVTFFAGDYGDPAVTMTAEDSGRDGAPVVYCAYGDGDVVFSGGTAVSADGFSDITAEDRAAMNFPDRAASRIKKADLSGVVDDYDASSDVLFSDSGVVYAARFPSRVEGGSDQLIHAGLTIDANHIRIYSDLFKRRIEKYHTTDGMYLYGYLTTGWYKDLLLTDGYTVDEETGAFDFLIPHPESAIFGYLRREPEFASEVNNLAAVVNVSEELDAKDEYFFDTYTKTLYVYAPSGTYGFAEKACGVTMDHTDRITFRGLTFTLFRDAMISGKYCHGITVDRCRFSKCAGDCAVDFNGCEPGRDFEITVADSEFTLMGCRAFRAVGCNVGADSFSCRGNVEVRNNLFEYTNLANEGGPDGAAVAVNQVNEAHVHHNEFNYAYRGAVSYCRCKNLLAEYNSLNKCMYNSSDGGVFYANESQEDRNNVIRYNVFYPSNWYAAYIDDNEPGTVMYGNLFYRITGAVVHEGRSSVLNNNALIGCGFAVTSGVREYVENAVAAGDPGAIASHYYYRDWQRFFDTLEANPEMKAGFEKYYPETFELSLDLADVDSPNFVLNPVNEIRGNRFFYDDGAEHTEENVTYAGSVKWCDIADNLFFTHDENPIFVNPTLGDYRIREGADFPDIHFEDVGRY